MEEAVKTALKLDFEQVNGRFDKMDSTLQEIKEGLDRTRPSRPQTPAQT